MASGRHLLASSSQGTTSASMVFGGNPGSSPNFSNATEEFTGEIETVTASTLTSS